jgi:glycosyltransferase involved in cell wall biosynthesis
MRILQVANGYPHRAYGGVELHTYRLVRALRERGHDLAVFTRRSDPREPDGTESDEMVDAIPVRSVVNDFEEGSFVSHYRNAAVEESFSRFVRDFAPDVVHVQHLIGLSSDLPALAQAFGARVVATVHEYWYACARVMFQHRDGSDCPGPAARNCVDCVLGAAAPGRGPVARVLDGLGAGPHSRAGRQRQAALGDALGVFDRITTPSRFVIEEFARQGMPLAPDRTRAIALGIEGSGSQPIRPLEPGSPGSSRPLRIGFVGHALHHKGPHVLLEALRRMPDAPLVLELWGARHPEHPYDRLLEVALAGERRAEHRGRFGEGDLPGILAGLDLLVVPSTCLESFGIATREAFLAGRPVVSSDRGALPESVRDGIDGLVVPGDDPAALAGALERLLSESGLLESLARGAVETAATVKSMDEYAAEVEDYLYLGRDCGS